MFTVPEWEQRERHERDAITTFLEKSLITDWYVGHGVEVIRVPLPHGSAFICDSAGMPPGTDPETTDYVVNVDPHTGDHLIEVTATQDRAVALRVLLDTVRAYRQGYAVIDPAGTDGTDPAAPDAARRRTQREQREIDAAAAFLDKHEITDWYLTHGIGTVHIPWEGGTERGSVFLCGPDGFPPTGEQGYLIGIAYDDGREEITVAQTEHQAIAFKILNVIVDQQRAKRKRRS